MRLIRLTAPRLAAIAMLLGFASCSPGGQQGAAVAATSQSVAHPESGLPVVPLTISSGHRSHRFSVEVASTPPQQAKGLMFRARMGADEGMIFPMKPPRMASFWMRNTVIPLDLLFIGTDHRVLNIAANAVPYDESPLASVGPVIGVLELNGGRAAELGIAAGDRVDW